MGLMTKLILKGNFISRGRTRGYSMLQNYMKLIIEHLLPSILSEYKGVC